DEAADVTAETYDDEAARTVAVPLSHRVPAGELLRVLADAEALAARADTLKRQLMYGAVDFPKIRYGDSFDSMLDRIDDPDEVARTVAVTHGVCGLISEVGEMAEALRRHLLTEEPLDVVNWLEEDGDCQWYLSRIRRAFGRRLLQALRGNALKLRRRYPIGTEMGGSTEAMRDREAERQAIESV